MENLEVADNKGSSIVLNSLAHKNSCSRDRAGTGISTVVTSQTTKFQLRKGMKASALARKLGGGYRAIAVTKPRLHAATALKTLPINREDSVEQGKSVRNEEWSHKECEGGWEQRQADDEDLFKAFAYNIDPEAVPKMVNGAVSAEIVEETSIQHLRELLESASKSNIQGLPNEDKQRELEI